MTRKFVGILLGCLLSAAAWPQRPAPDSRALLDQGRSDAGVQAFEAEIGTNPFDPVAMNNLAAVKATREDWYSAAKLLVRAHRLAPDNTVISSNLKRLNDWLAQRAEAAGGAPVAAPADPLAALPPEPPPLWTSASAPAPALISPPPLPASGRVAASTLPRVPRRRVAASPSPPILDRVAVLTPAPVIQAATASAPTPTVAPPVAGRRWYVQIGVFAQQSNALSALTSLQNLGYHGEAAPFVGRNGASLYRLRLGPYTSGVLARQAQAQVAQQGYPESRVVSGAGTPS